MRETWRVAGRGPAGAVPAELHGGVSVAPASGDRLLVVLAGPRSGPWRKEDPQLQGGGGEVRICTLIRTRFRVPRCALVSTLSRVHLPRGSVSIPVFRKGVRPKLVGGILTH